MNSFALIIGHCVVIPPSAKAALLILNLTFGIGNAADPAFFNNMEADIAQQYVLAGKTPKEAGEEITWLNGCFLSYKSVK